MAARRVSRTFKLRLSPAGMDLLIDSHCHLIRCTRALLAWGTTLHVAVDHLDSVPPTVVADQLGGLARRGLDGKEEHHLGAPHGVNKVAARIARKVGALAPGREMPTLASVYLIALLELIRTDRETLRTVYTRTRTLRTPHGD